MIETYDIKKNEALGEEGVQCILQLKSNTVISNLLLRTVLQIYINKNSFMVIKIQQGN